MVGLLRLSRPTFASGFQIDSALQIRTATEPFEISQLRAVLDAEHYLKAGRPAGHVIWQGVYEHDAEDNSENLVAVLCWAGAAKRLKDREDAWIGWDAGTCANWTSDTECAHGRIEYRELRVAPFDLDTSLFPGARQVASLTRYYQQKCVGEPKQETRHFILSIEEGAATLVRLAKIARA